jgi:putative transposase
MKYALIRAHQTEFHVRAMCRVLRVHFSGFYAWLKEPLSHRAREDARQTELIRQAWSESGSVYGYRKLNDNLRDQGEICSENRVAHLASHAGIAAQIGYKRRPGRYGGKPAVVATNTLDRQFEVDAPDKVWGEPLKAPLVRAQWRATSPTSKPMKDGCIYRSSSICSRGAWSDGPPSLA